MGALCNFSCQVKVYAAEDTDGTGWYPVDLAAYAVDDTIKASLDDRYIAETVARGITERPHAPSGVAEFMTAHSKTPSITPSMEVSSGKGVVRGRRGQQLGVALC